MPPAEIQPADDQQFPVWLLIVAAACLPATAVALARLWRGARSGRPLPLPVDNAYPAIRWPPWFGLALFIVMMIGMPFIAWGYARAARAGLLPWEPLGVPPIFSPGMFLAQVVPPLVGLGLVRLFGRGSAQTVGIRVGSLRHTLLTGVAAFAAVLPVCLGALAVNTAFWTLFGGAPEKHPLLYTIETVHAAWVMPLAIFQAAVLASLAEEFIYRGVLLMTLLKEVGVGGALVLSSIVFAAVHFATEPQAVLPLFVLALAMGYAAYRTRSLLAPVVTHALFNGLMIISVFMGTG
jgi:membrane protease YdiL (CAAX protease family)